MSDRTLIVATLGPASDSDEVVRGLIQEGVNIFRCNFSHGTQKDQGVHLARVRRIASELNRTVLVLADLQGPKFRLGLFEGKNVVTLNQGDSINLKNGSDGSKSNHQVLTTGTKHTHVIIRHLNIGERVFIDDGQIVLEVTDRVSLREVTCRVLVGGEVSPNKGINIPDSKMRIVAITDKDLEDCMYIAQQDFDYVGLSFVQHARDVKALRRLLKGYSKRGKTLPKIICKIEKPLAMENIGELVAESDGCMVARGDLAVECGIYSMPGYQRDIIARCNAAGKLVIVATDMLKSMIKQPFPERSEVSDIAHAVFARADAVMLSGEVNV